MQMDELLMALEARENTVREKWNRMIPRAELLNDRWEKAKRLAFEEGANIYDSAFVFGDVHVGAYTWVGPYTLLDGTGGLKIGKYCNVSAGVQLYTHSSMNWVLTGGKAEYTYSATTIGDCVYIGSQCIIDKGVEIGSHSVIAANSYVNRSFPPFSVIAGTPAKCIGEVHINEEHQVTITYIKE